MEAMAAVGLAQASHLLQLNLLDSAELVATLVVHRSGGRHACLEGSRLLGEVLQRKGEHLRALYYFQAALQQAQLAAAGGGWSSAADGSSPTGGLGPAGPQQSAQGVETALGVKAAECQLALGREKEALRELERLPPQRRTPWVHAQLGRLYRRQGMRTAAVAAYKACLQQCPYAVEAALGLAELRVPVGREVAPLLAGMARAAPNPAGTQAAPQKQQQGEQQELGARAVGSNGDVLGSPQQLQQQGGGAGGGSEHGSGGRPVQRPRLLPPGLEDSAGEMAVDERQPCPLQGLPAAEHTARGSAAEKEGGKLAPGPLPSDPAATAAALAALLARSAPGGEAGLAVRGAVEMRLQGLEAAKQQDVSGKSMTPVSSPRGAAEFSPGSANVTPSSELQQPQGPPQGSPQHPAALPSARARWQQPHCLFPAEQTEGLVAGGAGGQQLQEQAAAALATPGEGGPAAAAAEGLAAYWHGLAELHAALAQEDWRPEVLRRANSLLALCPSYPPALVCAARLQAARGADSAALALLERAAEADPYCLEGADTRAELLKQRGDAAALATLAAAVLEGGQLQRAEVWLVGAAAREAEGEVFEAAKYLRRALERDEANVEAHLALGSLQQRLVGSGGAPFSGTAPEFARALQLQPSYRAYRGAVQAAVQVGNAGEAASYARRAVADFPACAACHALAGLAAAQRPEGGMRAESHYLAALQLDPLCEEAAGGLADLYISQERSGEAAALMRRQLASGPSDALHAKLGQLLLDLGQYEEALGQFHAALGHSPTNSSALEGLRLLERILVAPPGEGPGSDDELGMLVVDEMAG